MFVGQCQDSFHNSECCSCKFLKAILQAVTLNSHTETHSKIKGNVNGKCHFPFEHVKTLRWSSILQSQHTFLLLYWMMGFSPFQWRLNSSHFLSHCHDQVKEEMLFEALTTRKTVTVGERLIVPYKLSEVILFSSSADIKYQTSVRY